MIPLWFTIPIVAIGTLGFEPTRAARGLASQVEVEYEPVLRPRADQTPYSAILVRVTPAGKHQRIEFIGTVTGDFDLRDHLERDDGKPLTDLARIPVTIFSQLPADHGVDLYATTSSWMDWRAHYREVMWGAAGIWIAIPFTVMAIRAIRRPRAAMPPPPPPPAPTVAELLRSALENACDRQLSVEESARLELLLFQFLRGERVADSSIDISELLREFRENNETRTLVLAIERWLHAADSDEAARRNAATALDDLLRTRLMPNPAVEVQA